MLLDLTSAFEVLVRNCSGADAGALVKLAYARPGGTPSSLDDYGVDELRINFTAADEEIRIPIAGFPTNSGTIVDVQVVGFRLSGGNFEQRVLGAPLQAERIVGGAGTQGMLLVTDELKAEIQRDVFMRSLTNPDGGAVCSVEVNQAVADNRGRDTLRGVFVNKVMCSKKIDAPDSCSATGADPPEGATHAQQDQVDLAPEAFLSLRANQPTAGSGNSFFNVCCDPGHTTEAVVQCGQVVVQEIMIDGQWVTLSPMVRIPWAKDIQVINLSINASNVTFGCDEFGSTPVFDPDGAVPSAVIQDSDNDGTHDDCDFLVNSQVPEGSMETIRLKHNIRLKNFTDSPTFVDFTNVQEVSIGGVAVPSFTISTNKKEITMDVPPGLPPGEYDVELCEEMGCTGSLDPAAARDKFRVHRTAFVSMGGQDHLYPFDETTGAFIDLAPSFGDSVPNIPGGAAPAGVLYTTESDNENKEVLIGAGTDIFAYQVAGNQFLDLDLADPATLGASLGSTVGALALPVGQGNPGERVGEFLFALHGDRDLSVIDVRATSADRFSVHPAASMSSAVFASDLEVRSLPNDEFMAYVTFSCLECNDLLSTSASCGLGGMASSSMLASGPDVPITPCPPQGCGGGEGGGGGGGGGDAGPRRSVGVSIIHLKANFVGEDLLPGASAFSVLCYDDVELSAFGGDAGGVLGWGALPWDQVGMDFTSDGSELFIADPERDQLFILDTYTNEVVLEGGIPKTIPVGVDPFDVEILEIMDVFGFQVDRAYVANNGDDTMTIVDVDPLIRDVVGTQSLDLDFGPGPWQVGTMAGSETSKLLFLVSPDRESVLRYKVEGEGIDEDNPSPEGDFIVGPSPRRVALKK